MRGLLCSQYDYRRKQQRPCHLRRRQVPQLHHNVEQPDCIGWQRICQQCRHEGQHDCRTERMPCLRRSRARRESVPDNGACPGRLSRSQGKRGRDERTRGIHGQRLGLGSVVSEVCRLQRQSHTADRYDHGRMHAGGGYAGCRCHKSVPSECVQRTGHTQQGRGTLDLP